MKKRESVISSFLVNLLDLAERMGISKDFMYQYIGTDDLIPDFILEKRFKLDLIKILEDDMKYDVFYLDNLNGDKIFTKDSTGKINAVIEFNDKNPYSSINIIPSPNTMISDLYIGISNRLSYKYKSEAFEPGTNQSKFIHTATKDFGADIQMSKIDYSIFRDLALGTQGYLTEFYREKDPYSLVVADLSDYSGGFIIKIR